MAASPKQREKVRDRVCIVCYSPDADPAHLWPRAKGGCDDPDCVVPLCREHHRAFDENRLELLPKLIEGSWFDEMAHPISKHWISPTELVKRLTKETQ